MILRLIISKIKDIGMNTVAFGIYISMQQLIIMPLISRLSGDSTFSRIILFVSIFSILTVVIGDELGNTRLVRFKVYNRAKLQGDFYIILVVLIFSFVILSMIANMYIQIPLLDLLLYILVIVFGIIRFFAMSLYKLQQRFEIILLVNFIYCLGALIGIYILIRIDKHFYVAPFLFGEVLAFLYIVSVLIKNKSEKIVFRTTAELKNTLKVYSHFSAVSLITNCISYLDRIIILPILGPTAMAIYYSASTTTKVMASAVNPIAGVYLAKLANSNDNLKTKAVGMVIKLLIPVFMILAILGLLVSYLGVMFLYPSYLNNAVYLLFPISIANAISMISFLIRPIIMRFFNTKDFLYSNLVYAVVFIIGIYFLSIWLGIIGFAWAVCIARFTQFASYVLTIYKSKTNKQVEVDNAYFNNNR
ncbi:lipopolysaccharide biosynthesis protein [Camelliibacillus cellulosilyticus]|uniref:Lipopolysaccharide biosynthesis protein n=1 Tax=Camelliibacillus cellulosilyticus TaxID=2174486 RepID=A0ABV9GT68_9BACL